MVTRQPIFIVLVFFSEHKEYMMFINLRDTVMFDVFNF